MTRPSQALDGMFAFALWDARRRRLLLARDRTGKKPLFYHDGPGLFAFASEVKALLAHPGVPHERDETALPLYLTYGYVPTPRHVLPRDPLAPARAPAGRHGGGHRRPHALLASALPGRPSRRRARGRGALPSLLRRAVERRLVADVPLGAFLSGGLDSSSVVALMAEAAGGRVRTFTIGFAGGQEYDEREHARVVAQRFGTEHTEFVVEPRALDLIDRLVWHHDGPFGDSSAIPTYLLSELTRSHVTVALNGDGGDEVFAGYLRLYGGALAERFPRWAFRAASAALGRPPRAGGPEAPAALRQALRRGRLACRSPSATCAGTAYFTERSARAAPTRAARQARARIASSRATANRSSALAARRRPSRRLCRACCSSTSRPTCPTIST